MDFLRTLLLVAALVAVSFRTNAFWAPHDLICSPGSNSAVGTPGLCKCYDSGYGVDRENIILAIHKPCGYFSQYVFGRSKTQDATYAYYYSITDDDEEGTITVYLGYYADVNGQSGWCAEAYPDGITLSYDQCFEAMHNPIDGCDTGGEDHKQGGFSVDLCLAYTVDPNPRENEPDRAIPLSWDPVHTFP